MTVEGCEVMVGGSDSTAGSTISDTLPLTTAPALFDTCTEYTPSLGNATDRNVSVALLAPAMFAPSRRHWNVNGPVPSTPTAKVAVLPEFTVTVAGCVTMLGGTAAGAPAVTLSTAALLDALPAWLLTTTL